MYRKKIPEDLDCGLIIASKAFAGKWKPCIIDCLANGIRRPGEIQRAIPTAPARVIKMQLRELEVYGLVCREVHAGFPLRVEYFLTETGEQVLPIIAALNQWGLANREKVIRADEALRKAASEEEVTPFYAAASSAAPAIKKATTVCAVVA